MLSGRAHPFEDEPLVSRMLIDDDEPVLRLSDDVGRGDLPSRHSEREAEYRFDRRFGARGGSFIEEALFFGHRHAGESRVPSFYRPKEGRIPAFAGMPSEACIVLRARRPHDRRSGLLAGSAAAALLVERVP
jgi:hypothetical protein